jgi:putative SOS response-associated peptidase YedK
MCHDLSFTASTVDFITDILPDVLLDGQLSIDFCTTSHVLSMSNRKCLCIYSRDGRPHVNEFEWGLIADYMNTPELIKKYRLQMANARSENVLDKKSAWFRLRKNRCLVAVSGVYEHRQVPGWKNKIPYFVKLKNSTHILLPGFYNYSPLPNKETGEMTGTFSILTRPANELMQKIHNHGSNKHRMPVFMSPEMALAWIREENTDEELAALLAYEIPSTELDAWPVYMIRTTAARPDHKEKFMEYAYENLPGLDEDAAADTRQASLF